MNQDDVKKGLDTLLRSLGDQLPLLEAKRAGAEMYGAPRLSFYELIEPNENTLSRIIVDLFDPGGVHGQGPLFLNALLGKLDMPRVGIRDIVRANREVLTQARRRIDIVVETPSVLLGVENKPWAPLLPNQLKDYLQELKGRAHGRQVKLVFLSNQEDRKAEEEVTCLPYHASSTECLSLSAVLSSTLNEICAMRARIHVEDFIRYIEVEFGETEMCEEKDRFYVNAVQAEFEGSSVKKKALAVSMLARSSLHRITLNEIAESILSNLNEKSSRKYIVCDNENIFDCLSEKWSAWCIRKKSWPETCSIAISAERKDFQNIIFGIQAPDRNRIGEDDAEYACDLRPQLKDLSKRVPGGNSSAWWPWYKSVEPQNLDPEAVARLVIEAPDGRIKDHQNIQMLINQISELAGHVDEIINSG